MSDQFQSAPVVRVDVDRQPVSDPDELRLGICAPCGVSCSFEWIVAYEDGTDDPPLRLACSVCGSAPGQEAFDD